MPVNAAANESQYFFFCENLPDDTFQVIRFSGKDTISVPYEFNISLTSKKIDIKPDNVIGLPATLFIFRNGKYYPYSGIVIEFELLECDEENSRYNVKLVPTLWLTSLNYRSRVFQNLTITEIIRSVLCESNISNFTISINSTDRHEFVVQYQETDLNFISRLMENLGIWYFFNEQELTKDQIGPGVSHEQLIITDNIKFSLIPEPSKVIYRLVNGMSEKNDLDCAETVNVVHYSKCVIPSEVVVKNYNYRNPEVVLSGKQTVRDGNRGTIYEYGGNVKTVDDAQNVAQLICRRIKTRQVKINGKSNCRAFRAGFCFEMIQHCRKDLCIIYLITSVNHAGGVTGWTYQNEFKAIPDDSTYKYAPEKISEDPKVNGIITAQVEAGGSEFASIDDQGRYKVRLPFDVSSSVNDCNDSKYIRLAQPYSGSKYGIHFPAHQGTEMVLACINGDPNKLLGIGTVPNANTMSPVVSTNKQENVIRTAGGNVLIMDDTDEKQNIKVFTKGLNGLKLDDESECVVLTTRDLNQVQLDDKNSKIVIKSNAHTILMNNGESGKCIEIISGDGNLIKIDDKEKKIIIRTSGGHKIDLDDQGKRLIINDGSGKNNITLDENNGLRLESLGNLTISAKQDIELSATNIKLNAKQGNLDFNAASDVKISGININQNGTAEVKIEAAKLDAMGSTSVNVNGAIVEMNADAIVRIKGNAMAEFNGGAMATVKGGMVMIN